MKPVPEPADKTHFVVLFDGVCNLCHFAVQFILARDPADRFRFASLQSDEGQAYLKEANLPLDLSTVVLIEPDGRAGVRSTAALRIMRRLHRAWPLMAVFMVVPPCIRDAVYNWVVRNRYRWFGQKDSCPLPDPAQAHRFLS